MLTPELLGVGDSEHARRHVPPQVPGRVRELAGGGPGVPPSGPCGLFLEHMRLARWPHGLSVDSGGAGTDPPASVPPLTLPLVTRKLTANLLRHLLVSTFQG